MTSEIELNYQDKQTLQNQLEWLFAYASLHDQPYGSKLKRSKGGQPITYSFKGEELTLTHSYLFTENNLFQMAEEGKYLGKGAYSAVKFALDPEGNKWALKICKDKNDVCRDEDKIAQYLEVADKRVYRPDSSKSYIPYKYLGKSLHTHINRRYQPLSEDEQLDLAIKTFLAVRELHDKGLAHLDIKPANLTIDDEKNVHLIDFGLTEEFKGGLTYCKGTPLFMPTDPLHCSKEALDVFAAMRSCWLPPKFQLLDPVSLYKFEESRRPGDKGIFTDAMMGKTKGLKELLNTANGKTKFYTASDVTCGLILCKNGLYEADIFYAIKNSGKARKGLIELHKQGKKITPSDLLELIGAKDKWLKWVPALDPVFELMREFRSYVDVKLADSPEKQKLAQTFVKDVYARAFRYRLGDAAAFDSIVNDHAQTLTDLKELQRVLVPFIFSAIALVLSGIVGGLIIGGLQMRATDNNQFLFFKFNADTGMQAEEIASKAAELTAAPAA